MGLTLRFLGATATVTGSRYLVDADGARVLVDCGLFQGYKPLRLRNWAPPPFDPKGLAAIVLTHAHLDHSGYLPVAAKLGFAGRVYCTEATRDLCATLLRDSAHLQEEEAEYANRHGYSKHAPALPLYTRADAEAALELLAPVAFERDFQPAPGITARMTRAGHILGAAIVTLDALGRRVVFSGDLGRPDDAVMNPPARLERADALVLESTYGNRAHERGDPAIAIERIVKETAARGGTLVVPAFAVGRAQALLLILHRLKAAGRIPASLPVYLDSPMATEVTRIYLDHPGDHRLSPEECRALGASATFVATPEASKALDQSSWPAVMIAGSGMATGGRVLHHLARFAPDPRNAILFAGFQAGGTRGASLLTGAREVKIHGQYVPVRASVHAIEALSAHADYGEILGWLRGFRELPRRIFLTHGEPDAADALRGHIRRAFGAGAEQPEYLETAAIG